MKEAVIYPASSALMVSAFCLNPGETSQEYGIKCLDIIVRTVFQNAYLLSPITFAYYTLLYFIL